MRKLLGLAVVVVIAAVGAYFLFVKSDAPPPATVDTDASGETVTTLKPEGEVEGDYVAAADSFVGYRIEEVLSGLNTTAFGRTSEVAGTMTIAGTEVTAVDLTVQVGSIASDKPMRDNQFKNRIMQVSQFPTATFKLTQPIDLGTIPTDSSKVTASATGDLTLHGVTKSVTFDTTSLRSGTNVRVTGSIPITFTDYGIDDPSGGPAQVGETGTLEFTIVFAPE